LRRPSTTYLARKKKSSPPAHRLVVGGRGGAGGRGHPGGKRGGRGGGRGHNGNRKVKTSSDGNDGAEDDKQPAKGPMCYNCRGRGHFARDCTVKLCKRCHGKGHEEDKCPSPADMKAHLTIELPDSDAGSSTSSEAAAGFMAREVDTAGCGRLPDAHVAPGKCDGGGPIGGVGGLALRAWAGEDLQSYYFDSGASGNFSPSADKMINYRPCNKTVAMASDQLHRVEGRGNLVIDFQSGTGTKRMELIDVGYVPTLSYNLISLAKIVKAGHKYSGDDPGLTVHLKSGEDLLCPVVGDMYISYGRRVDGDDIEHARAVIAPGLLPTTDVDINQYHRTTAHTHPRLLRGPRGNKELS